ncbi:MAG: acetate--CoA ligase family protein [Nitrospirae bacterium]|nr:acetate--CoA ligase family protein [Nitrospirota bacterium]
MAGPNDLKPFFYPASVAVIGASQDEIKPSGIVLKNLLNSFSGRIYPVNPHYSSLHGIKCFPSIKSVPDSVDLSVLITPPDAVPALLREHAEKGVRHIIIATSGFGETVGGEGLEQEIREIAASSGIRIIGPNCLGVFHPSSGLDTFFLPVDRVPRPSAGNISVISQSGSVLGTTMILLEQEGIGIAKAVSYGNRVDVSETDLLEYLSTDEETAVIGLCIESIEDGRRFISTAQRCNKPVVAFKLGQEPAGRLASRSHTGSMSGKYEIFQAAFRRSGIFETTTIEEFLDLLKALSIQRRGHRDLGRSRQKRQKQKERKKILILTNAGGIGVMTADLCSKAGLAVPEIPSEPLKKLKAALPSYYSLSNPIDLTGNSKDAEFGLVLKTCLDYFDAAILIPFMTVPGMTPQLGDVIISSIGKLNKLRIPIVSLCPFSKDGKMLEDTFGKCCIPLFPTPSRLVKTLAHLLRTTDVEPITEKLRGFPGVSSLIRDRDTEDTNMFSLEDKKRLLDAMNLSYPESVRCKTITEAVSAARRIGFPVAMKIVSPDIIHKTNVGGVRLGVRSFKEIQQIFRKLINTTTYEYDEKARILGVDIEKMVQPGVELIIGGKRDPRFGPLILFGLGGIFTEVIRDTAIEIAPVTHSVARRMMESIKGYQILNGIRNMAGVDLDAIEEAIVTVSEFISAFPEIEEMEFNPVIAYPKGIIVVDVRILYVVNSEQ